MMHIVELYHCICRYLIQTIQYYPKPIIATINKPAEGVGAQLIALCDMVCDKVWDYNYWHSCMYDKVHNLCMYVGGHNNNN